MVNQEQWHAPKVKYASWDECTLYQRTEWKRVFEHIKASLVFKLTSLKDRNQSWKVRGYESQGQAQYMMELVDLCVWFVGGIFDDLGHLCILSF